MAVRSGETGPAPMHSGWGSAQPNSRLGAKPTCVMACIRPLPAQLLCLAGRQPLLLLLLLPPRRLRLRARQSLRARQADASGQRRSASGCRSGGGSSRLCGHWRGGRPGHARFGQPLELQSMGGVQAQRTRLAARACVPGGGARPGGRAAGHAAAESGTAAPERAAAPCQAAGHAGQQHRSPIPVVLRPTWLFFCSISCRSSSICKTNRKGIVSDDTPTQGIAHVQAPFGTDAACFS